MYDMYPTSWSGQPLDGAEVVEREGAEHRDPTPRRRPRRAHSVAPRVRAEHR
ncbi:hypothetical protein [Auraticoccus monumenti]|uniref:Uncharacterized protein n=1 Tax=Auraticoccus monumenti TaxID=675864 RepID=A0A1G7CQQ6_9ACTN|nr:hypothetical protein [Auraticoccus monumenti]SDE41647.1 hypothetical protein SAMN04489747_3347 [Auraticoccus monumenti]